MSERIEPLSIACPICGSVLKPGEHLFLKWHAPSAHWVTYHAIPMTPEEIAAGAYQSDSLPNGFKMFCGQARIATVEFNGASVPFDDGLTVCKDCGSRVRKVDAQCFCSVCARIELKGGGQ